MAHVGLLSFTFLGILGLCLFFIFVSENKYAKGFFSAVGAVSGIIAIIFPILGFFGIQSIDDLIIICTDPPTSDSCSGTSPTDIPSSLYPQTTHQDEKEDASVIHYQYRVKEYEESSKDALSGWTRYDSASKTIKGDFSSWQYTPIEETDSIEVRTETHYKWRTLSTETTVGDWSAWTTERRSDIASNVEERIETYPLYGYYYFECPNCGFHMHVCKTACAAYAGGCGQYIPDDTGWHSVYLDLPWDKANLQDWHGTGHFYTIIEGERWYKWQYGDNMSTGTRYSYRESVTTEVPTSDWYYSEKLPETNNSPIQSMPVTAYAFRPITTTTTYYYWRWSDWKDCSETDYRAYQNDNNKEVRIRAD